MCPKTPVSQEKALSLRISMSEGDVWVGRCWVRGLAPRGRGGGGKGGGGPGRRGVGVRGNRLCMIRERGGWVIGIWDLLLMMLYSFQGGS